jgi:hypothetical protein
MLAGSHICVGFAPGFARQACMVLVMTQLLTIKNRISSVIIGGGGWGGGAPPSGITFGRGPPVTRNAEIDPGDNDPRWVQWPSLRCDEPDPSMSIPAVTHRNIAGRSSSHSRHYDPALQEQVKPPGTRLIALRAGAFVVLLIARHRPDIARR